MKRSVLAILAAVLAANAVPVIAEGGDPRVIASYPHGAFLENIDGDGAGTFYITSYVDRRILRLGPDGAVTPLATLDVHPSGIAIMGDRVVVASHAASFTNGLEAVGSNALVVLSREGTELARIAAPQARFLNALVALDNTRLLATDSVAGKIWLIDTAHGTISAWFSAEQLLPPAGAKGLGANGMKLRGSTLFVSNSARQAIYALDIAAGLPSGPLRLWRRTGGVDDFAVLPSGAVLVASHGPSLVLIEDTETEVLASGCDGCTSLAVDGAGRERSLIVLTSGNLLAGGDTPARILRLPFPEEAEER